MKKLVEWLPQLQVVVLAVAGSAAALITLLDLLHMIDARWFTPHTSQILLLLVSFGLIELLFQREYLSRLERLTRSIQVRDFSALRDQVDPQLKAIFGDHITAMLEGATDAIANRTVRVDGMSNLRSHYNKTLALHPHHTFYAASIASESYYWQPGTYEQTLRSFISNGGHVERIFFTTDNLHSLSDEEKRVISIHLDCGVSVYVIADRLVPPNLKRLFVVERAHRLGVIH